MSKVAFTTLLNREDSALSPHFGMAKWILIRDDDDGQITFEQNTALNGRAVVDIIVRHGCTDAVFTHIGPGAFRHLEQAGIRGWIGPADMPLPQLLEHLSRGELAQAQGLNPCRWPHREDLKAGAVDMDPVFAPPSVAGGAAAGSNGMDTGVVGPDELLQGA